LDSPAQKTALSASIAGVRDQKADVLNLNQREKAQKLHTVSLLSLMPPFRL